MQPLQLKLVSRKSSLPRPNTARLLQQFSPSKQGDFNLMVHKLHPAPRKPAVNEASTSPMVPFEIVENATRKRIIITKNKPNYVESPSLLVTSDVVKEYERNVLSQKIGKNKCPLTFLSLPLPFDNSLPRNEKPMIMTQRMSKRNQSHYVKLLKRQFSGDSPVNKKPQRMFDYNEIFNITTGKISFK